MMSSPQEASTPFDLDSILDELEQLEHAGDADRRVALCRQALKLIRREEDEHLWGWLHHELGTGLDDLPHGDRADNLEQAIHHYLQALQVFTRDAFPSAWGGIQNDLAIAYAYRIEGERADNLETAIHYYRQALQVFTREASPVDWAMTQNNLANAYADRIRGERDDNLEQAIRHYRQSLKVYTRDAFPTSWAMTQNNLGTVFRSRIRGEHAANLEQAIYHYEQALEVYTRETFPTDWAMVQNNLAVAYRSRIRGKRNDNLEQGIFHCRQALQVYERDDFPADWARAQHNLAHAYAHRIRGRRADNLEKAIHHYGQALLVRTRKAFPVDWADTQINLASVYMDRIRGERAENVERAIHLNQQALEVCTREAFPIDWAGILNNLALAYSERIHGERAENLEKALYYCQQVLQVYSREAFPTKWAMTQNSLGDAYVDRIRGERADNLEQAIYHYRQALHVYAREAFPQQWAMTHNNLAIAHRRRIRGNKAENLEKAIHHYEQALQVYMHEAFPEQWAMTQNNLAAAFQERIDGEQAQNLEKAIHHYRLALDVYGLETYPKKWAMIQNNLALAYHERLSGERADNLEQAIYHCRQALRVYARKTLPTDWAGTQHNLALIYADRAHGDRKDNLEQAIDHYQRALQVHTLQALPSLHLMTQRNLGNLYFEEQRWPEALSAFEAAIAANRLLLDAAFTESGRRAEVGETAQIFARSAYALLRMGQWSDALSTLEQGKTRLLVEALALAEADWSLLSVEQRRTLQDTRQRVRELEAEMHLPPDTPGRRDERKIAVALEEARISLNQLVEEIRVEHPEFMPLGLDLPELLALIPANGVLVAPLVTSQGSAAFVIPSDVETLTEEHVLWLNGFSDAELDALFGGDDEGPGWLNSYEMWRFQDGQLWEWKQAINSLTGRFWPPLMEPIHRRLQELGMDNGAPVLLMPQGGLGLLPLHAAWREVRGERRYFLDDYTVTYTPSGYALDVARRRLRGRGPEHSLLAVVNPTGDLPFALVEADAVTALLSPDARALEGRAALQEAVTEYASGRSYLHFSCHGFYDWDNPMQSGLTLADGATLSLSDIINTMALRASRLVILSACETGITDVGQSPDEYLGLPAGFLQAGAPGVVSALWAVNDVSTAMLVTRFYEGHLRQGLEPAAALRQAQQWLRDSSDGEKRSFFLKAEAKEGWLAPGAAKAFYQALIFTEDDEHSFAHPYHWAAFTFSGA